MRNAPQLMVAALLALCACGGNGGSSPGRADRSGAGTGSETAAPRPAGETPEDLASLPAPLKGYELYAWDDAGEVRFTLITGTNREKTAAELTAADTTIQDGEWVIVSGAGLPRLTEVLQRIPAGTQVTLAQHRELPALSGGSRQSIERALADAGF